MPRSFTQCEGIISTSERVIGPRGMKYSRLLVAATRNSVFVGLIFSLLDDIQLDTSSIQLITQVTRLSVLPGLQKNESWQSSA